MNVINENTSTINMNEKSGTKYYFRKCNLLNLNYARSQQTKTRNIDYYV